MSGPQDSDAYSRRLTEADKERSIRDLMGLLVLPSLWAGRDGGTILQIMTEAVERIIMPLRFSFAQVMFLPEHPPLLSLRVARKAADEVALPAWQEFADGWASQKGLNSSVFLSDTPIGKLRIIRFNLGYTSRSGTIWFGSDAPEFPTGTQIAFMRAATSLAANGIQTARVSYEREEASRAKDEFLAMLGHELRNPLAPISAAVDLVKLRNGGELSDEMQIIERQVGHLSRLVDDLLDVSRITRGKIKIEKQHFDLKAILHEAIEDCSILLEERQHELTVRYPDGNAWIFGDATRIRQVFLNLLTNAAKYTEPGGQISVSVESFQGSVAVSVRDNGLGISPQLMPRLFNIFQQGSSTIDRSKGGLGIGLALVKNFVELHGGTVAAASDGIGCGSCFTVVLPLVKEVPHAPPDEKIRPVFTLPRRHSDTRILIVDDNSDALKTLSSLLKECGFEIAVADNPIEALVLAERFRPQLALLDIGLPIMDGYQLAKELRRQFPLEALRLFALTGYGQPGDRDQSSAAGFERHLVKPVDIAQLISFIDVKQDQATASGNWQTDSNKL